ncbi:MAG: hypothetical protein J5518_01465 [Lachnospiraceae bacterium]|nr:hypothetical protein [Lachnospiraceae bacterium]MBO4901450.1 hypothetical protein [Lachnospiraceae bacterium]
MQSWSPLTKAILATVATFALLLGIDAIRMSIRGMQLQPNWLVLIIISVVTGVAWYFTAPRSK